METLKSQNYQSNPEEKEQSKRCVQLFVTPWTLALQAPLPMEFSRQEYWSGLSFPNLGDLPDPGIKPTSLVSPALAGRFFTIVPLGSPRIIPTSDNTTKR